MSDHFDTTDFMREPTYWRNVTKRKTCNPVSDGTFVHSVLEFYKTRGYITDKQRSTLSRFMSVGQVEQLLKSMKAVSPDEEPVNTTTVFGDYKMNLSDTFLTENPKFKFVSIVFAPYSGSKEYHYKTLLDIEVDDFVVVQTPNTEYQCVQVRAVVDPLEIDLVAGVNYKWVVQKVDMAHYEECREMEKQVQLKLRKAEARKRQKELRESATEFLTEEERAETVKLVRL